MQTLHLRFRALRAISRGHSPRRWRPRSMRIASTWKGAPPLPDHPRPTSAVGLRPGPASPRRDRYPLAGAGLALTSRGRAPRFAGSVDTAPRRVCRWQTARGLPGDPAPHVAGDHRVSHRQARASEALRVASAGLSFLLRPQPSGGRPCGGKTGTHLPDGSGTRGSGAPGLRPTGRVSSAASGNETGPSSPSFYAVAPAPVTGQEPAGTGVPGAASRCERAPRRRVSSSRGEGGWLATTSP